MRIVSDHGYSFAQPGATAGEEERLARLADERRRLTGISGWLAVFFGFYALSWLGGIVILVYALLNFRELSDFTFLIPAWIGRIALLAGLFATTSHGSRAIRAGLWVQTACAAFQLFMLMAAARYVQSQLFIIAFLTLAWPVGWLIYFGNSLRVKYTYDEPPQITPEQLNG